MIKVGKKIVCLLLVIVMAFMLVGCGAKGDAKKAFNNMMQAFQTGEAETISKYYDFNAVSRFVNADDQTEMLNAVLEPLKSMQYQVISVEKLDGANVRVTASITSIDFTEVMDRYIKGVMEMVVSDSYQDQVAGMSKEDYQKLLASKMTEVLAQADIPKTDKEVSVTMVKKDGEWVAGGDSDELLGALFGNLTDAVNSLI